MKDLQDYLDALPLSEVSELGKMMEKEDPTHEEVRKIYNTIKEVYEMEMDIKKMPEDDKLIDELYSNLKINVALYENVRRGDIKINSGRLEIKHNASAMMSLTPQGIKSSEKLIASMLKK